MAWGPTASAGELIDELKHVPYRIVYETYRDTNWELFLVDADGSNPVNLTGTSDVDELYPHASPDGSKICFVADEGEGDARVRSVYTMNVDGSGRTLVARNARQPFFNGEGTEIAYLKGESEKFTYSSIATKGLYFYDLATGEHREHPNREISHLFGVCWSPCGKWILATVHGGLGYRHAIIGIKPIKVYHLDWPPEGKYVVFTRGPAGKRLGQAPEGVGVRAEGWNLCVADVTQENRWVAITSDGKCNKEPDWVPHGGDGR
jgi:hypothetical protein